MSLLSDKEMQHLPLSRHFVWLAVLSVLGLNGCQTAQHLVAFTEARRDPQLARMFTTRLALEERYRECRIAHPSDHAAACASYRADLDAPLALSAVKQKLRRRNWLVRPKSAPGG